jgi:hypothetical protein
MKHITANTALCIGVAIGGLISGRAPLHAQPTSEPLTIEDNDRPWNRGVPIADREAARELFLEGNRLFNIPLFTRAAEKYIAAVGKWKHPAFYFNLALAQLNLGQEVEARNNLEQALKHGEEPLGPERFKEAQKQLQELEHQLGRIRITCQTEGAEVTLDGTTLFTGPGTHDEWVKAAPHESTAKKSEYATQTKRVNVGPGKLEMLDLSLRRIIEERPWAPWKPWAVVGAGVVIAATSGGLHAFSAKNFRAYDDGFLQLPCEEGCTDQQIHSMAPHLLLLLSRARLEQRIAIGGYITGGLAVATGAVLAYSNRPHLVEHGTMSSPSTGVAIVPTVSVDMLGVLVTVSL